MASIKYADTPSPWLAEDLDRELLDDVPVRHLVGTRAFDARSVAAVVLILKYRRRRRIERGSVPAGLSGASVQSTAKSRTSGDGTYRFLRQLFFAGDMNASQPASIGSLTGLISKVRSSSFWVFRSSPGVKYSDSGDIRKNGRRAPGRRCFSGLPRKPFCFSTIYDNTWEGVIAHTFYIPCRRKPTKNSKPFGSEKTKLQKKKRAHSRISSFRDQLLFDLLLQAVP